MEYSRPFNQLNRCGVSLDFMYDESMWFLMESFQNPASNEWDILRVGTTVNYEIIIERLSAGFYFGAYLHNVGDVRGYVYQRLGLRYRLMERLWAHMMLKTHWGKADYLECGLAFKII